MKSLLSGAALFIVVAALATGGAGCSKKPKNLTPLPAGRTGGPAPGGDVPLDGSGSPTGAGRLPGADSGVGATDLSNTGAGNPGLNDSLDFRNKLEDREIFAADTIYFDFDKSNVKPQFAANVSKVADYLKGHPGDSLLVEGHCDERGTEEYNLALGERRAQAIRDKLMAAGISGDRITTISYGREKPAIIGTGEESYEKNRRGVFVLLLPPGGFR